jgi:N-acetyl-gamma-glutamyl-phosphate reductase
MPASAPIRQDVARSASRSTGIGILGATGYAGVELVRLLSAHPGARVLALGSRQDAGAPFSRVWPSLPAVQRVLEDETTAPEAWAERGVEILFSALPHGALADRAGAWLGTGIRVVDLSADHRPGRAEREKGSGRPAVYGLTEWCGTDLDRATLVANPGCYATAILLALLPAARSGWIRSEPIIVNALSGVSGAGRAATLTTHFVERIGSAAPYRVGEEHAHLAEIAATLGHVAGTTPAVIMNPHLVPMARGILATLAVPLARRLELEEVRAVYSACYADAPFVRLLDEATLPETRWVCGSNRCDLALRLAGGGHLLLVFAALDNLMKGAAGQAVQNFNRMMGLPETTGLPLTGWSSG